MKASEFDRERITGFLKETWPLNRSLAGDGINRFFEILKNYLDVEILEYDCGSRVCGWKIPMAWKLNSGSICNEKGEPLISTESEPLCVWSHSEPVSQSVSREELFKYHLAWSEELPDSIPYRYNYYDKKWGFSVPGDMLYLFNDDKYHVTIDSEFYPDKLRVGRYRLQGKSNKTVLIAAHIDHPYQLADGLSGAGAILALIEILKTRDNLFTYEFLFVPETIGTLAYFSDSDASTDICYSIFLDIMSVSAPLNIQKTLKGDTLIDRISESVANDANIEYSVTDFRTVPGNDEVIINGPGIGIPSLSVFRWPFKYYHTSSDDFGRYDQKAFDESVYFVSEILELIEKEIKVLTKHRGMPSLSGNGLWEKYGQGPKRKAFEIATSLMDGMTAYSEIQQISGFSDSELKELTEELSQRDIAVNYE